MNREIDGDVENARQFRQIHTQEEDVAPPAVAEVHPDRRGFTQYRKGLVRRAAKEFGTDAQRIISRMAGAKHPLIAENRTDTSPHLVGKRLKSEAPVSRGERAPDRFTWSIGPLGCEEDGDGFLVAAIQQFFIAAEGYLCAARIRCAFSRHIKPVNRIEEEEAANPLVEIGDVVPEVFKLLSFGGQLLAAGMLTE